MCALIKLFENQRNYSFHKSILRFQNSLLQFIQQVLILHGNYFKIVDFFQESILLCKAKFTHMENEIDNQQTYTWEMQDVFELLYKYRMGVRSSLIKMANRDIQFFNNSLCLINLPSEDTQDSRLHNALVVIFLLSAKIHKF